MTERMMRIPAGTVRMGSEDFYPEERPVRDVEVGAFWADPSHSRPLSPEAGLELCRLAGFGSAFVFHPDGSGNVEGDRFHAERYALVACPSAGALDLHAAASRR